MVKVSALEITQKIRNPVTFPIVHKTLQTWPNEFRACNNKACHSDIACSLDNFDEGVHV